MPAPVGRRRVAEAQLALLSRLSLVNYRNFREAEIALPAGVSVFYGGNAQGKTALLEAAYTLAVGRSFRAEREREVVHFDAARNGDAAYVTGVADCDGQTVTAVVGYQPRRQSATPETGAPGGAVPETDAPGRAVPETGAPGRAGPPSVVKQIRVNRQPTTAAGLVGRIGATLFAAADLDLALGAPSERRRYLDVLICQAQRVYLNDLQRYQAALRQRNGLLRRRREGQIEPEELEYWDDQLAQSGSRVALARAAAIVRLAELADGHHRELTAAEQTLALAYRPSVAPLDSVEATAAAFRGVLRRYAAREEATATTAAGPHRDDCAIFVNGLEAGVYASRGQARTVALALRLAEADYLAQARGDDPVILLDDVFSEMDGERRERVLQKAAGYRQTLITTTDADLARASLGDGAAYFRVADGAVRRDR